MNTMVNSREWPAGVVPDIVERGRHLAHDVVPSEDPLEVLRVNVIHVDEPVRVDDVDVRQGVGEPVCERVVEALCAVLVLKDDVDVERVGTTLARRHLPLAY
eukprot:TRINITY_DN7601_c0_g1_i2.p3 TRINITY_DN7601_c0_g1~~TRINITY_DN7601_c0_g1_i2.p3  ORF type:complete len:102 (-),score=19.97 TRINITY_DN7601_c0_g1_i2:496-801(-)